MPIKQIVVWIKARQSPGVVFYLAKQGNNKPDLKSNGPGKTVLNRGTES